MEADAALCRGLLDLDKLSLVRRKVIVHTIKLVARRQPRADEGYGNVQTVLEARDAGVLLDVGAAHLLPQKLLAEQIAGGVGEGLVAAAGDADARGNEGHQRGLVGEGLDDDAERGGDTDDGPLKCVGRGGHFYCWYLLLMKQ